MDDLVLRLELALELAPELDQPRQLARLDLLLERGVEGAAEGHVDRAPCRADIGAPDERRHVAEA